MGEMSVVIWKFPVVEKIYRKRISFSLQMSSELGL